MIVQATDVNNLEVYINTDQIIQIYEAEDEMFNVYLTGEKVVQINRKTLGVIIRETS